MRTKKKQPSDDEIARLKDELDRSLALANILCGQQLQRRQLFELVNDALNSAQATRVRVQKAYQCAVSTSQGPASMVLFYFLDPLAKIENRLVELANLIKPDGVEK